MARKDPIDQLLKEYFVASKKHYLKELTAPDIDEMMARVLEQVKEPSPLRRFIDSRILVKVLRHTAALTAVLLLAICLRTMLGEAPHVLALPSQVVRHILERAEDLTIIRSSDIVPDSLPEGAPPPPPPDAPEASRGAYDRGAAAVVTQIESHETTEVYDTLVQARQQVNFPLLQPGYLPKGFILEKVEVIRYPHDMVIVEQSYRAGTEKMLRISQKSGFKDFASTTVTTQEVVELEVLDMPALMFTNHISNAHVFWHVDTFQHTLSGMVSSEEMIRITQSLEWIR